MVWVVQSDTLRALSWFMRVWPVHTRVISGFSASVRLGCPKRASNSPQKRPCRAPMLGLEPAIEGPFRSQGGLTIHCAIAAPLGQVQWFYPRWQT
ncbi:hypothetical protein PoB_001827200 [Plakobranchus ocellatus]|uniref:Ig-like domain-containing protein n=1 Tax=Plakobranchus ocellatus TaxID=259542 RepID=A0AAV3ZBB0_9GAST|nr:hypothetical protein PoB_001827200 [Plakobranchus ocellatus]